MATGYTGVALAGPDEAVGTRHKQSALQIESISDLSELCWGVPVRLSD
jgi:hypothetical protein